MPPLALNDDLVGEVLLRFPLAQPELLVRAALVCKRWWRLIFDPGFIRRFREFHTAPPMLGFLCTRGYFSEFVHTSSVLLPHAVPSKRGVVDARHGRVLLNCLPWTNDLPMSESALVVWNPITDEQRKLPKQVFEFPCSWTAAVLCSTAADGCNNLDSFLVVFLCTFPRRTFTCVYSSEAGAWSKPSSTELRNAWVRKVSNVLVGNTLYFISDDCRRSTKILKHDLGTQETSLIRLPQTPYKRIALSAMVHGGLGFAVVHESKLYLWSREAGPKAYAGWAQSWVIELETLI